MRKKWFAAVLAAVMVAGAGVSAQAATAAAGAGDWQFEVTPYVWALGLDGNISVNNKDADFNRSFSDLVDQVDVAGSVLAVAQYQKYVGFVQADYFKLKYNNDDFDQPLAQERLEEVTLDQTFVTMAAGYQFPGFVANSWIDVMLAARVNNLKLEVKNLANRSEDETKTYWDPALVVRPSFFLTKDKKLRFNPTLSIGGGGDSELLYELQPQFQYDFTENIGARLGYRRLYYKIEGDRGDTQLKITYDGLIAGVSFLF
jgi:hypothetical protein